MYYILYFMNLTTEVNDVKKGRRWWTGRIQRI